MTRLLGPASLLLLVVLGASCPGGSPGPADLDTKHDACSWCRMGVSDRRFAAQRVAPAEEPLFFDDIGCLAEYVKGKKQPAGWTAFVADHRTKTWTPASAATYTRVPGLMTPMSSHVIAHSDAASRDADPDARGGAPVSAAGLFGEAR